MKFLDSGGEVDPRNHYGLSALIVMQVFSDGTARCRPPLDEFEKIPPRPPPYGVLRSPEELLAESAKFEKEHGRPAARPGDWTTFELWWQGLHIICAKDGALFTRSDIVLAVANTDGGSHVDPGLREAYDNLSRNNSLNWVAISPEGTTPLSNPVLPTIRQIAFEVERSLVREFPELSG